MNTIIFRLLHSNETWFLKEMLWEAIFIPEETKQKLTKSILDQPDLRKYYAGWGRTGDVAIVAVQPETGKPAGCAWGRLFPADDKGYGFIDEITPELSIAVDPVFRGQGIGTKLLQKLIKEYGKKGYLRLSLSVNKENPSLSLYYRSGFKIYAEKEDSIVMSYP
ncbi:MAG: GNAT family N-acetyltransferase [Bacteroidales bacterium]|nr:GNAT family N-acetyltransferase [Bacteroidales bacterium]